MQDVFAGYPTYWDRVGHGDREALLIHCSLAHSGAWRGVRSVLEPAFSTLAFDLPGHGRSADWDGQGDFQDAALKVALDLLAREAHGPVDLIGHSYGGTVALRLAQVAPEIVRSLTLFEPVLFEVAANHPSFAKNDAYMHGPFADAMRADNRPEAARLFNALWGGDGGWENLPPRMREDMARRIHLIPAGKSVTHEDVHGQAAPGALEAVKMPVLLMEGGNSPDLVRAVHDRFERRLPNSRRVVISGAGHMAPISHPREVAHEIKDFLGVNDEVQDLSGV